MLIIGPKNPTCNNNLEFYLTLDSCSVYSFTSVRNLGVLFDSNLSFENHISSICKTAFFHLKNISKWQAMLSTSNAEMLIHALMTSRLDYCNNFTGWLFYMLDQQTTDGPKCSSWLPIKHRIDFKIVLITYKALNCLAPQYLSELLSHYSPPHPLHYQNSGRLIIPRS